jgi:hypothetical protein
MLTKHTIAATAATTSAHRIDEDPNTLLVGYQEPPRAFIPVYNRNTRTENAQPT